MNREITVGAQDNRDFTVGIALCNANRDFTVESDRRPLIIVYPESMPAPM